MHLALASADIDVSELEALFLHVFYDELEVGRRREVAQRERRERRIAMHERIDGTQAYFHISGRRDANGLELLRPYRVQNAVVQRQQRSGRGRIDRRERSEHAQSHAQPALQVGEVDVNIVEQERRGRKEARQVLHIRDPLTCDCCNCRARVCEDARSVDWRGSELDERRQNITR